MRQRFFIFGKPRWAAAAAWLVLATPLWAASNIIAPAPEYQAADQLTTVNPNGYDVFGDQAAVYADGHLELYNRNTWSPVCNLGDAGYGGLTTAYNSFVKFDPSGQSVWVGYTVGGDTNDRIYQVTNLGATPTWNYVATMPSNYDLAFSGTTPYVSGPNSTTLGAENCIWRMNPTTGQFTEVAAVGGFAAGIAFDAAGNLYYGTDSYTDNKLLEFPAAQVSAGWTGPRPTDDFVEPSRLGKRRGRRRGGPRPVCSQRLDHQHLGNLERHSKRGRQLPRDWHGRRRLVRDGPRAG